MMSVVAAATSEPATLVLHAVRLLGFADTARVAARFGLDRAEVEESLLDFEAFGWVRRSSFADTSGWALTEGGRTENERRLAAELEERGACFVVADVHERFLPLNARFLTAVTRWQTHPLPGNPMAANDHTDFRWDERVIDTLTSLGRRLGALNTLLAGELARLDGYASRYDAAPNRVIRGEHHWVDGIHTYSYDAKGRLLTSSRVESGSGITSTTTVARTYDSEGRLIEAVQDHDSQTDGVIDARTTRTLAYDDKGRILREMQNSYNGADDLQVITTISYAYTGETTVLTYEYDNNADGIVDEVTVVTRVGF